MKIRILNQSIRFRISQDELNLLSLSKVVTTSINFPNGFITFSIDTKENKNHINLLNNNCQLIVDRNALLNLHLSDETSLTFTQDDLEVLLEKDFKCLTRRDEDESNLFENPRTSHN